MNTIRVVLLEMRPRLRDILADAVQGAPDMQVVARDFSSDADLGDLRPDVLVCGAENALDPDRPRALLEILPKARVLMVAHSGRQAVLFELRPTRVVLPEVSLGDVIAAVRSVPFEAQRWQAFSDDLQPRRTVSRDPAG